MPYADTDFILSMLKPKDWLKGGAEHLFKKYKGTLWTSPVSLIEVMLLCHEFGLDVEEVIVSLYELIDVRYIDKNIALAAAHFIKDKKMRVFDALHAAYAMDDAIISSDDAFDKAGLKRIPLK